jgi:hypothetical protein
MNIDIQPFINLYIILFYIKKYISKLEKSSLFYIKLQSQVLFYINNRVFFLLFVSKILNKLIGKQD